MTTTTTCSSQSEAPEHDFKFRVWVGCLACYNEGKLVGEWFDAEDAPTSEEDFNAQVKTPRDHRHGLYPHEELWVFDHENSPKDGEYSPNEAVSMAEAIKDLRPDEAEPFRIWLDDDSTRELDWQTVERFRESYAGRWDKAEDYVHELYADQELPGWAENHRGAVIASIAEDMRLNGEHTTANAPGLQVYIFRSF